MRKRNEKSKRTISPIDFEHPLAELEKTMIRILWFYSAPSPGASYLRSYVIFDERDLPHFVCERDTNVVVNLKQAMKRGLSILKEVEDILGELIYKVPDMAQHTGNEQDPIDDYLTATELAIREKGVKLSRWGYLVQGLEIIESKILESFNKTEFHDALPVHFYVRRFLKIIPPAALAELFPKSAEHVYTLVRFVNSDRDELVRVQRLRKNEQMLWIRRTFLPQIKRSIMAMIAPKSVAPEGKRSLICDEIYARVERLLSQTKLNKEEAIERIVEEDSKLRAASTTRNHYFEGQRRHVRRQSHAPSKKVQ